ncbi:hypothetical protein OOK44_00745 [Streptomyces cellulosae]|uniref:hypothetical protein n=1 Tax=Streptomyces TaxID=1883 RepID=UPI0022536F82|nr:hypothetical protein [Streptomyces cellulosae]WSB51817.1 hypothetical protein OHA00_32865 [Streptomyces cellulosae]WTB85863.1 hypothetical protein OG837_33540 [Streptomyces cellulosae]WUC40480.1 hypothetical protein OG692_00625 [Streptomyces cellulosae]
MGRSRNNDASDSCIGIVVLGLIIAFFVYKCDADELGSEPSPRPAVTVTETVSPPHDAPAAEETEEPAPPEAEEEEEEDHNDGPGGQDSDGQVGIQFGYACSPVGALGVAGDGRPAKCFMGKDGRARWGYDSNRG